MGEMSEYYRDQDLMNEIIPKALPLVPASEATPAPAQAPMVPVPIKAMTAQEARVVEVTDALGPAYAKAATLDLSEEEVAKLTAPFPDSVVEIRPHDGLIFIPHIFITKRLNEVFRPGQWSLICRRHWFDSGSGTMFGEYVMVIRGCYVGESVGGHPFQPNNPKVNYSDTLESCAAEAKRRIAGKMLSCGSQVWEPEYARAWVTRHGVQTHGKWSKRPQDASEAKNAPVAPVPAISPAPSKPATAAKDLDAWLEKCRAKLVADLAVHGQAAVDYAVNAGLILPNEALADAKADSWFPKVNRSAGIEANMAIVKEARDMHLRGIEAQMAGEMVPQGRTVPPAPAKPSPTDAMHAAADAPAKTVPTTCPKCHGTATKPDPEYADTQICQKCGWRWDENGSYWEEHRWQIILCPVPPPGTKKIEYTPITMGQLARTDSKRWYGLIMNTTVADVKKGREWKGKHYDATPADIQWAEACEAAKAHLEASRKKGEEQEEGDHYTGEPVSPDDDIPF